MTEKFKKNLTDPSLLTKITFFTTFILGGIALTLMSIKFFFPDCLLTIILTKLESLFFISLSTLVSFVLLLSSAKKDQDKRNKNLELIFGDITSDGTKIKFINNDNQIRECSFNDFKNRWHNKGKIFIAFTLKSPSLNIIHFCILKKLKQMQTYSIKPMVYITIINKDSNKNEDEKQKEKKKIKDTFIKVIEYYLGKKGRKWELKEDIKLHSDIIEKLNGTTIQEVKNAFGINHNPNIEPIIESLQNDNSINNISLQCEILKKIQTEESNMYFVSLIIPLVENKITQDNYQPYRIIGEKSESFLTWSKKHIGNNSPELIFVIPTFHGLTPDDTENALSFKFDTGVESYKIYPLKEFQNNVDISKLVTHYEFFVQENKKNLTILNDAALKSTFEEDTKNEFNKIEKYLNRFYSTA